MKNLKFTALPILCIMIFCFDLNSQDHYWVGGSGAWSDNNHRSTALGDVGGGAIPTTIDSVIFDANSFRRRGRLLRRLRASVMILIWII